MPVLDLVKLSPPLVERQTPIPSASFASRSPVAIRMTESGDPEINTISETPKD